MTLNNLIGLSIEAISADKSTIDRLIEAAKRNIRDSKLRELSLENRFDVAYKAIMQIASAALYENGYRTLTSKPGHHATLIQLLPKTMEIDKKTVILLDVMRKQRNVADYSGDLVSEGTVNECIIQAEILLEKYIDRFNQ